MFGLGKKTAMPSPDEAPVGQTEPMQVAAAHLVTGNPMRGPYPDNLEVAVFGMGCFWGVERLFWQQEGIYTTAAGYAAGYSQNPGYEQVCTGATGHNEVVQVVFDPARISFEQLLKLFWENHDPTQGMRQGNDIGTQYRSGIYPTSAAQATIARQSLQSYQQALTAKGMGEISTEIIADVEFYFAEDYHQQYLQKNPGGYCNMHGTGVGCFL